MINVKSALMGTLR